MSRRGYKTFEYSNEQREMVAAKLFSVTENGNLRHGAIQEIACELGVSRHFVANVWRRLRASGGTSIDFTSRNSLRSKARVDSTELAEELKNLPLASRKTLRDVSQNLGVSTTTINKMIKEGQARPHSSVTGKYYLAKGERAPRRTVKHKRHIPKKGNGESDNIRREAVQE